MSIGKDLETITVCGHTLKVGSTFSFEFETRERGLSQRNLESGVVTRMYEFYGDPLIEFTTPDGRETAVPACWVTRIIEVVSRIQ
jgi:hypothetical protein